MPLSLYQTSRGKLIIILLIFLLSSVWGINFAMNKYVMLQGTPLWDYACLQALGTAIVLLVFSRVRNISFRCSAEYRRYYFYSAVWGIVIPNTMLYYVAPHLFTSELALIVNTVPLIVYPLALFTKVEQFSYRRLSGLFIGIVGMSLVILSGARWVDFKITGWFFMALLCPLCYAICTVYVAKYRPPQGHSITLSMGMLLTASILLSPMVLLSLYKHVMFYISWKIMMFIILNIIFSGMGYALIFELIYLVGPVSYSLVNVATVLMAMFWGWVFFLEPLSHHLLIAVILIVGAIFLVTLNQSKQRLNH